MRVALTLVGQVGTHASVLGIARALARQLAEEDDESEQKERIRVCESPYMPDTAQTSKTSDQ